MPDLLDALRESGGSTEPDSAFRAELMGRVRDALAAPDVSGDESTLFAASTRDTTPDRRRTSIVLVAAALVAAAIAGIVWYGARRTGEPATPSVDTSLSDRAFAPLSGEVFAVSQAADGLVLDHRQFAVTESGPRLSPRLSTQPAVAGPSAGQSVVDVFAGLSSVTTVTCCDDAGGTVRRATGDDWLDGEVVGRGTRFDDNLVVGFGYVDPLTGTVVLGNPGNSSTVIDEPGAVDVTVLAAGLAAALVAGDDPRVVVYDVPDFTGAPQQRDELPAPDGACALIGLDGAVVVFSGHAEGDDQCIADHGTALDISSGGTIAEFDLPEPLRSVSSDHAGLMAGTTPTGALWVGTLEPEPAWYLLSAGDFSTVDIWGSS